MAEEDSTKNIEKLVDAESYAVWKFDVEIAVSAIGLEKMLRLAERPTNVTEDIWIRHDGRVKRIISSTIDKKAKLHIMKCTSAKEMFDKLASVYEKDTEQNKHKLLMEFYSYQYDKKLNMIDNIAVLENLAVRLSSLSHNIDDDMIIGKVMSILPQEYRYFSTAWQSTAKIEQTLANFIMRLSDEEAAKKQGHKTEEQASVFKTTQKPRNSYRKDDYKKHVKRCFKCNSTQHLANNCDAGAGTSGSSQNSHSSQRGQNFGRFEKCGYCGKGNHTEERCFHRKGDKKASHVAFYVGSAKTATSTFLVDSGATSHMTNDREFIKNMEKTDISYTVANGQLMAAEGIGQLVTKNFTFNGTVYVPDVACNLLSVSSICSKGGEVTFTNDEVTIKKDGIMALTGQKCSNGTYVVDLEKDLANSNEQVMSVVAHRKLGHLGVENMKKLQKISSGLKMNFSEVLNCDICKLAGQKSLPFKGHLPKAQKLLEIVSSDVGGPIEVPTFDGERYYITFQDTYSRFNEVHLFKYKSEVADIVKSYILRVENEMNTKVVTFKCDNGTEYSPLKEWFKEKGIILDNTPPYCPQINGGSERLNLTLCTKMRALLFDSGLSKEMWGEAIKVACYLTNRSPFAGGNVTPYELWYGKQPDLSNLQLFGCNCFAKIMTHRRKLDERSTKMTFVGYARNGYRLWNGEKIVIAKHVIFDENLKVKPVEKSISLNLDYESCENSNVENSDLIEEEEVGNEQESADDTLENVSNDTLVNDTDDSINDVTSEIDSDDLEDTQNETVASSRSPYELRDRNAKKSTKDSEAQSMLTFQEVMTSSDKEKWAKAIADEKNSLLENHTWTYVPESEVNGRVLDTKWVFKVKDSGVYKGRLVVKGYQQKEVDNDENYSPVVNISTLRVLLAEAAAKNFNVQTFDIKTAFLCGELENVSGNDVYIRIPEGFEKKPGMVCKLKKGLYGLKIAPLCFNLTFKKMLKNINFTPLKTDSCIFTNGKVWFSLYVDDGLCIGMERDVDEAMSQLKSLFKMSVNKDPKSYIGMDLLINDEGIKLSQESYIQKTLNAYGMSDCKSVNTPIIVSESSEESESKISFPYRAAVGSLLYLSSKTRPDISFAVGFCARSVSDPKPNDCGNVKRILRYLKGSSSKGLWFKRGGNMHNLLMYSDADYANASDRKSTSGYVCYLNNAPIVWCSRKQSIVSLSSTESEFISAAESVKEVIFLRSFMSELLGYVPSVKLFVDNTSAIALMKKGIFNKRSKHIDVKYHYVHDLIESKVIDVTHISTDEQTADIFTKPLLKNKFQKFANQLVQ